MTLPATAAERAATYWNAPETVRDFASLTAQPYLVEILSQYADDLTGPALDLGCGGGRNTVALLEHGCTVVAVDLHQAMVDATRDATAHFADGLVTVRQGAAHAIPADDDTFALAVCYGVLHNAPTPRQFQAGIAELARVLRPGAVLALNTFTSDSLDPQLRPGETAGQYVLPDGVPMTLLPTEEILAGLAAVGLRPEGEVHTYVRDLDVGPRAVLRCELRHDAGTGVGIGIGIGIGEDVSRNA
ncbi:class I SAM-dependent methyltransferase [Streptomyces sp. NPDC004732]|uniref:class I SAM-dependent methyltransferase n=1 Tax=Streptomyces sp. NPDC004732 TaxID=3154290 RepID=UPI0033A4284A